MKIVVELQLPPEVIALVKKLSEDIEITLKTSKTSKSKGE